MFVPYFIAMCIGISTYWLQSLEEMLNSILYMLTTLFSYIYSIYLFVAIIKSNKKNNFTSKLKIAITTYGILVFILMIVGEMYNYFILIDYLVPTNIDE